MTADVLALLDDDDQDAAYLAACGLVGEGAAVEYLTWRREADLPDPADVVSDPHVVRWQTLDPSRVWAAHPRPDVVVVLSDGYTPWPEQPARSRLVVGIIGEQEAGQHVPNWATTVVVLAA